MAAIVINGRFLGRDMTGVERYATNLLQTLDARIGAGDRICGSCDWLVLAPRGIAKPAFLPNIAFQNVGRFQGHLWEQLDLMRHVGRRLLVSLCNSGPVLHTRQLVVIHDASPYRYPQNFSRAYRWLHKALGRLLAARARLATVSRFSQGELSRFLSVPDGMIAIIPNGCDHLDRKIADFTIVDRLGLRARPFVFCLGSHAWLKNTQAVAEAFRLLQSPRLALVRTGSQVRTFVGTESPSGYDVIDTGRLSDAQITALYLTARALVFPSLYEGFGIPPLEAMALGCPVLASNIPPIREVCQAAACYFDPTDAASIARTLALVDDDQPFLADLIRAGHERAAAFSWAASLDALVHTVATMELA